MCLTRDLLSRPFSFIFLKALAPFCTSLSSPCRSACLSVLLLALCRDYEGIWNGEDEERKTVFLLLLAAYVSTVKILMITRKLQVHQREQFMMSVDFLGVSNLTLFSYKRRELRKREELEEHYFFSWL
jgi:hypothetical protein